MFRRSPFLKMGHIYDCFHMAGNVADSNDRLKILLSGRDREVIQRQRTTAGKPSGQTAKEHFNLLAASTTISGVTTNVGKLINPVGTSIAANSASC